MNMLLAIMLLDHNNAKDEILLMLDEMQLQIIDMASRMECIEPWCAPSSGPWNTNTTIEDLYWGGSLSFFID